MCKEKTDVFQGCQVDGICRGCCRFRGWGLGSKVIQTSTSTFSQAALRTCVRGLQASRNPRLRAPENGLSEGLGWQQVWQFAEGNPLFIAWRTSNFSIFRGLAEGPPRTPSPRPRSTLHTKEKRCSRRASGSPSELLST